MPTFQYSEYAEYFEALTGKKPLPSQVPARYIERLPQTPVFSAADRKRRADSEEREVKRQAVAEPAPPPPPEPILISPLSLLETRQHLMDKSRPELAALCIAAGMKASDTRRPMCERLLKYISKGNSLPAVTNDSIQEQREAYKKADAKPRPDGALSDDSASI